MRRGNSSCPFPAVVHARLFRGGRAHVALDPAMHAAHPGGRHPGAIAAVDLRCGGDAGPGGGARTHRGRPGPLRASRAKRNRHCQDGRRDRCESHDDLRPKLIAVQHAGRARGRRIDRRQHRVRKARQVLSECNGQPDRRYIGRAGLPPLPGASTFLAATATTRCYFRQSTTIDIGRYGLDTLLSWSGVLIT